MEITITKCYVELESLKDLELEKKYDQYSINLIHHFIHFNQEKVERKLKVTTSIVTLGNIDKLYSKGISIFDDTTNKYEDVGTIEELCDYHIHSKYHCTTCTKKDKELSIRIVNYLWDNKCRFDNENPVDVQCGFSLNHKFEIKSSPMRRWGDS